MDVHPLPARALIAAALLASCGESAEVFEEPRTVEVAVIPAMWSPKLDILVVVGDRSGSEVLQYQLGRDIDALIAPLRADDRAALLDWKAIDALWPYGGIRIEDNVLVDPDGITNLTRAAFAAAT